MSQHAFVYFVLRARAFRACVREQLFVWRGSIISPTEEEPSPKCLVYKQLLPHILFKIYGLLNKCEVKMAGYWPSPSRSINSQKKKYEANIQPS